MAYFLGIDVGTSGTKALIMDSAGVVLATASAEHTVQSPRPGWSEQDPAQWWQAAVKASRAVIRRAGIPGRDVRAVSFSGQMHGLVCLDAGGEVLRPAIIWNDQRSAPQCNEITETAGGRKKLVAMVGNIALTSFTLTKLLWVRRHEPKLYDRIATILLPKDYVRFRLCGQRGGDVSDMSGTLMLDPRTRDWSGRCLSLFGIDRDILPPVVESAEPVGTVTPAAARELGLSAETIVVAGGGDQPVGAVGNGIVAEGLVSATMGTSGVVYVHSRDYRSDADGRVQTFCSSVTGQYCMFGCVLAAGGSFQWYRNVLGAAEIAQAKRRGVDPYELLTAEAAAVEPGCEGLFWLPYLTGERTPHADPYARACWIGITARTGRGELTRSVLEGATFAMNDVLSVLRAQGLKARQVRLSGGGARSDFWRQLQADVYGATCATVNSDEGPAYGAAILAAVGAGEYRSVPQACREIVQVTRTIRPAPRRRKRYAALYEQYARLYPALAEQFRRIAALADA